MISPPFAIPRIPHDIIFIIGGFSEKLPLSCIESYDTRADRWINVACEDQKNPHGYHGAAVIGHKIFCIGGFDKHDYINTCREFDVVEKIWTEVGIVITVSLTIIYNKTITILPTQLQN